MRGVADDSSAFGIGFILGKMPDGGDKGRYRGVDRLPGPDVSTDQGPLSAAFERYYDAQDSGKLYCELATVRAVQEGLRREGVAVDVIYVTIDALPGDLDGLPHGNLWSETLSAVLSSLRERREQLKGVPDGWTRLGFDISHPAPSFHSALVQPGLEKLVPDFRSLLNEHGLVPDAATAARLMKAANSMDYGVSPFCVLGIWEPPRS